MLGLLGCWGCCLLCVGGVFCCGRFLGGVGVWCVLCVRSWWFVWVR